MTNLYHIQENTLTQIADAARSITNGTQPWKPSVMMTWLRRIPTKIEPDFELNYFQGTLPSIYENSDINSIKDYIFYKRAELTEVSFAQCTQIQDYAFAGCVNLQNAYFPNCSDVWYGVFSNNYNLENINLLKCEKLGNGAFYNCSKLKSIYLPKCSRINNDTFYNCISLSSIHLPQCSYIGSNAFFSCTNLSKVILFNCSRISQSAFANNSQLNTLILYGPTIPSLYDNQVFLNTPLNNSLGSIYVPASLVDSYKNSHPWSLYSNIIIGFEEGENIP